jgi:uncharacterized YigZ family protein
MNTILGQRQGKYVEERSKFLSYSFFAQSKEEVSNILKKIKSEHPSSRHICYAYRIFDNKLIERSCEDGEPGGTAGSQILQLLKENEVINVLCVVVRYFGGIKLGTANLGRAYKESARQTLIENLTQVELKSLCLGACDYQLFAKIKSECDKRKITFGNIIYNNKVKFEVFLSTPDYIWLKELIPLEITDKVQYSC